MLGAAVRSQQSGRCDGAQRAYPPGNCHARPRPAPLPARAQLGLRGLETRHAGFEKALRENPKSAARAAGAADVPLLWLVPIGLAFGVDPVHLGIIFLANLELGYVTPPVGLNLFMSSYRFGKPLSEVLRAVIPVALVLFVGVLLITYVPALTTTLPSWFGR